MPIEDTEVLDEHFMRRALALAEQAADLGEVPVGAILVRDGQIIGEGYNQPISSADPTCHAEVVAIRHAAAQVQNYRLPGTTLYVTIEPCTMCLGALMHTRVSRLVYGASEPKAGVLASNGCLAQADYWNHHLTWQGGVLGDEASALMQQFFQKRRVAIKESKKKPL